MDKNELTDCCHNQVSSGSETSRHRRNKNWVVLALVLGGAALVWAVTMIKMQHGG